MGGGLCCSLGGQNCNTPKAVATTQQRMGTEGPPAAAPFWLGFNADEIAKLFQRLIGDASIPRDVRVLLERALQRWSGCNGSMLGAVSWETVHHDLADGEFLHISSHFWTFFAVAFLTLRNAEPLNLLLQ